MATGKILPSPLEDLPSDVLSVVLFHFSSKEILSLSATSKHLFQNVKAAQQIVLRTAQKLLKSLSVTDTVTTFISDLEEAIEFAYEVKSLRGEDPITDQEFRTKLIPLTRLYGYELLDFEVEPDFPLRGRGRVVTPSNIIITFNRLDPHHIFCRIYSKDGAYQFSKSFRLRFKYFFVDKRLPNSCYASYKVSHGASLREIVQAAKDIGAVKRLHEHWGVGNVSYVDIELDDTAGYRFHLNGYDQIEKYIDDEDGESSHPVSIDDVEPEVSNSFRFLFSLVEYERSERAEISSFFLDGGAAQP
jgi:hypothetical protein